MTEPFLGEIRRVAFGFVPKGWAPCDGRLLAIAQNQALFSLLGTSYGGNGVTSFGLPDLRGRSPLYAANPGEVGGTESVTLSPNQLPPHTHIPRASSQAADQKSPAGNYWADSTQNAYGAGSGVPMAVTAIANTGGSQAHENMAPFLVVNYIIALQGVFPSRT